MKKNRIVAIVSILFATVLFSSCGYNTIVTLREGVDAQWANVENQYQRRADLVPNLVSTVKGYAKHESEIFEQVSQARAQLASGMSADSSITDDPEKLAAYQKAQDSLGASLSRLIAIAEAYPDLKANQNFLQLQNELSDIENKLASVRRFFNSATKELNNAVQSFPSNIIAGMFGFKTEPMFEIPASDRAAHEKAPEIKF